MGFTTKFGNSPIAPANPQFEALALSVNTTLAWPLETTGGVPYVAAQVNVTPAGAGLSLAMPPANQGSTGVAGIFVNVGASSFTLTDNGGNQIAVIAAGIAWVVALTDNSTVNGTWQAIQLGATTSSAPAGSLAGYGLQANGSLLQVDWPTVSASTSTTIGASGRSTLFLATTAGIVLTLGNSATLGAGWVCAIRNQSGGDITLATTGGDTINGSAAPITIPNQASGFLVCQAGNFTIIGAILQPLSIALGGTGASTATQALQNLGGTAVGIAIFEAASAAAVVALLGLTGGPWAESTVATSVAMASSGTFYVCTAALGITLPNTVGLATNSVIGVYAQGGVVTITPNALDSIGGQAIGTVAYLGQGGWVIFLTNAAGNWFPLLGGQGVRSPVAASSIALTVTDQVVLVDTASGATNVTLAASQTQAVTVKDKTGHAQTNNITLTPPVGGTIDGAATATIAGNFDSLTVIGPASGAYALI